MFTERGSRISRRAFLGGSVGAASAVALWTPDLWTPARASALRAMASTVADPTGTTLESTIVLGTGDGYLTLREGPGWPTVERADLAALRPGRMDTRTALAAIVQLTDVHVVDAQSPGRVEFLDRYGEPYTGAFRPQETLTTQVQTSMVRRINQVARGPVTGRALDCAVSTGDNVDNQQTNELEWFMAVLNGGSVTANSGATGEYEGVQASGWEDPSYWHPDPGDGSGEYDAAGFPRIPGLLGAAIAPFESDGLNIAWYSCYGNHDGLIQGNLPTSETADALFVGSRKITDLPPGQSPLQFVGGMFTQIEGIAAALEAGTMPQRAVAADDRRRTIKTAEWVQAHLDRPGKVGPPGHGYDESHLGAPSLHYSFEIAPGVLGISLDTGGYNSGSIGEVQLDWLETELAKVHSSAFDAAGNPTSPAGTDQLVLLFSHFTIGTMNGSVADPANPDEKRYLGPELVAFLQRWPNIIGWVNGHTHTNTVTPVPDPSGRTNGFWEITTASHVDYPEQARIIEVVDNGDGTISLVCTMLEHAAPITPEPTDTSVLGLASISRELSANDLGVDHRARLGPVEALNVELALPAPFDLAAAGITGAAATSGTTPGSAPTGSGPSGGTGAAAESGSTGALIGVGAVAVAGAAVAGALVLRRRGAAAGAEAGGTGPAGTDPPAT